MFEEQDSKGIDLLYREDLADHPMWGNERLQNDSGIVVARGIQRAKTTLRLPCEVSPFGNVAPCTPKNMMTVTLPEDQMKNLKDMISSHRDADPETVFRATWRALHTLGYAGTAERAFESQESTEEAPDGKPHKDPSKMTQRQFEKWRLSQGLNDIE